MINSTNGDCNTTFDEYEKEFERVMQEQETLETCGRNAGVVTANCDISRADKQTVSPVTHRKNFIPINYAPCQLNHVQSPTQGKKNQKPFCNESGASSPTRGGESIIPIECAPCKLKPVQIPNQDRNKSVPSCNKSSVSSLTREGGSSIPNYCTPRQSNPDEIQTPTRGTIISEPSHNKSSVSAAIIGGESFIPTDCTPSQLNPVQIPIPTQGRINFEPSRNKTSVSTAISVNVSPIQIDLKKSPSHTTTNTHSQALGNCELSRNDSRVDYPPELNPFSEDDETERGKSTNPFGDSDDEENALHIQVIPPKPRPRHSFSTVKGLEQRYRLPVPLPRTASKSMPTTPNQSPLLQVSHSFHLPSSSASTYNSIRRKKKPAPPPPNHPIPDLLQLRIASPKTNSRPRKTRLAPPPPKPTKPLSS